LFKKISIIITALILGGCSFRNPFIPPSGTYDEVYDELPSQEPIRSKGMYKATMKPYTIRGKRYYPIVPHIGQKFRGKASWYGLDFHGGKTSNGEYYDMHSLTAAHKTLPMNTLVKVTNLKNGNSTIVRINDRGPFVEGRIIDLSYLAAQELGMIDNGTADVELEVIDFDQVASNYKHPSSRDYDDSRLGVSKETYDEYGNIIKETPKFKPKTLQELKATAKKSDISKLSPVTVSKSSTLSDSVSVKKYKVQLLSTTDELKAKDISKKYATIDDRYHSSVKSKEVWNKKFYRVLVGDFSSKALAKDFIYRHRLDGAIVVKD
jgi:rare lipoprotein A